MKRTAVIIINFRTPGLTIDCLETLVDEIDPRHDVVIVVDNDSGDDSIPTIQAEIGQANWGDWVTLVPSGRNGGFSFGNNVGIQLVEAENYLLLNSDTLVHPGAIGTLRRVLEEDAHVGLAGPRLEWPNGDPQISCFRYRNPISELLAAASTGPITKLLNRYETPLPVEPTKTEPDWASFACILIRGEVFKQVGLMDEGYFMYFEDIDYCRRARKLGWAVVNEPAARVVHLRGGSSNVKQALAQRKRPPRFYYESRARYFAKFYGKPGLWLTNVMWSVGRTIEWIRVTFTGRPQLTCEKEAIDNWIGWWNPLNANEVQIPEPQRTTTDPQTARANQ